MRTHVLVPRPRTLARPFATHVLGDFDALFDELWHGVGSPGTRRAAPSTLAPRTDFVDDENEIRIRAEMPGLDDDAIAVSLEDGVLTIEGRRSEEHEERDDEKGYRHVETWRGSYRRSFELPAEIDEDAVKADYKSGILTVTLPKRPEARPEVRTIPITTG